MKNPIPSFDSPPLNEVFLGIQFDPIEAFDITTYGAIWDKVKERFPVVEHHVPIEPSFEKTGARKQSLAELSRIKLEQFTSAQLPRAWFISNDGRELIQVQPNRFIRNWRSVDPTDKYPRYEQRLRPEFLRDLGELQSFFKNNGMGEIKPNQCEISYINHIDVGKTHNQLSEVFLGWSDQYNLSDIADIEDIQINLKHIIKDNDEFVGRLYIKVQPAFRLSDDAPIFLVELTIKGRPLGEGQEGVIKFMDMGREKIVRAFKQMTTNQMHDLWKIRS